jgi:hypothetical protein
MSRFHIALMLLISCAPVCGAEEPDRVRSVKKSAQELGAAITDGDYGKFVDCIYPKVVEAAGGREKMIKLTEDEIKDMKKQGVELISCAFGDPGEFHVEGNNTFVVVPEVLKMKHPKGKFIVKSYLLGVSSDSGKTWKFVDGAGLDDKIAGVLPKLPAKLKLPEKQKPEQIEDK